MFGIGRSTLRPHHASARPTGAALAFGSTSVDFKMSLPAYLTADCRLVFDKGRRQLRSATSRSCVLRDEHTVTVETGVLRFRSEAVEQPSN